MGFTELNNLGSANECDVKALRVMSKRTEKPNTGIHHPISCNQDHYRCIPQFYSPVLAAVAATATADLRWRCHRREQSWRRRSRRSPQSRFAAGFVAEFSSEEIYKGAIREVKEETGERPKTFVHIDSEFVEVVAFRHAHEVVFKKSDLFFVCVLKSVSSQIKVDDLEIQAAKWMPLMEFVEQPLIQGDCMFKKIIDICIARLGNHYCGLHPHQVVSAFDCQISSLYYNVHDTQDVNCTTGN
ncbi:hypothetical protein LWI28_011563 [Acer negundo]|uniref:Nudix hydrolase domain-containing protein n=1 Tax=Acer negundo TaxID=4023 RepID=A0AAD5JJ46_ACENE|nr:hypothetical protein LWI28_011563 [Acer negundo]